MHVLLLTQVFPPEAHPTAVMASELGRALVRAGHEVTVAAGYPHHPLGRMLGGYRRRLVMIEKRDGYQVLRGWHAISEGRSIAARATVMLSQALGTAFAAGRCVRPDVVVSIGLPLVGPLLASRVARSKGARLLTVVYDLYPDVAIESAALRGRLLVAAARAAERAVYARSDRILVLSQGFRRTLVARGVPEGKLAVLPVWLDPDEIRPAARENDFRRANGIADDRLVVLYAGTIGLVSGAALMLEVAERLRSIPEALVLFVGEGQVKDRLEQEAQRRALSNLRFLPFQPRELLNQVQAAADVSVVTLAPGRGKASVPSKVVGYLAAGRPVVASVDMDSDTAECVRGAGGRVTAPGDAEQMGDAIAALLADPAERRRCGVAARAAFEREYAAPAVLRRYVALLEEMAHKCLPTAG